MSRLAHSLTATQVLEGEEAFLRALHPGGAGAVGKAGGGATGGAYAEEERRLVRAAAKNVKKKLVRFLAVLAASVWRPVWLCLYVHGYHA